MSAPVFKAAFSDFKLVKTRGCAQLIFEVPIEEADAALQTLGGLPRSATEVWAAIARIDPNKPASEPRNAPDKASAPSGEDLRIKKVRQKFSTMPLPKQAAIRCEDPDFRRFLGERILGERSASSRMSLTPDDAATEVREICGVGSRSEIREQNVSSALWRELDSAFLDWKHAISYEGVATR